LEENWLRINFDRILMQRFRETAEQLAEDPTNFLASDTETQKQWFAALAKAIAPFEDDEVNPPVEVEADDDPISVVNVALSVINYAGTKPGRASRLKDKFRPQIIQWAANESTQDLGTLPRDCTKEDISKYVAKATKEVAEHPASAYDVFWAIAGQVKQWHAEEGPTRSRSTSRKRVSIGGFVEQPEPTTKAEPSAKEPRKSALKKERPHTPEHARRDSQRSILGFKLGTPPRGRDTTPKQTPEKRPKSSPPRLRSPPPIQAASKESLEDSDEEDNYPGKGIAPGKGYGRHPHSPSESPRIRALARAEYEGDFDLLSEEIKQDITREYYLTHDII
jgi:hypothetical protein